MDDKDIEEHKKFLEEQIEWYKEQDRILEEIEVKLYEMKEIAEYALEYELSSDKKDDLNYQLNELKNEVHLLQTKLYAGIVH